jgi:short-subunit dehydrogenase
LARRTLAASRILITGASSGIGRALAVELARAGARLVLNGRREDRLREIAAQITMAAGSAASGPAADEGPELVVGDITQAHTRAAALSAARRRFGGLDILINNAGVSAWGALADARPERLRQIMEVNFFALVEMTRATLPVLQAGHRPMVVNIASILGLRAIPYQSEYCASKFAVRGFSEAIRPELKKLGIDVLVVSPGSTESELFEHLLEKRREMPWREGRKLSAARVAAQIARAMRAGRHEIIPHPAGRLLVWLNRLAPRFVDAWMERY